MHDYFEVVCCFTKLCRSASVDDSGIKLSKKNHICLMLPQIPIEKCVSTEKLSDLLVGHKFCKILIFLFSVHFIKATSTVSCHMSVDFLEGTGRCSFSRNCPLNIQVLIITVSVLFLPSNKWYPLKKKLVSSVQIIFLGT